MARNRSVSRSKVIQAPASAIFDAIADPSMHPRIDGSGMVQAARDDAPQRLTMGAGFGMDMKLGVPYKISNTVVEFEEGRLLAWRHFGGHRWRWQLESIDAVSTRVTETFDWSTSKSPLALELAGYPRRNAKAMERTLERLAELMENRGA